MQQHEIFDTVQRRADLESREDAENVTVAVLRTLGERLTAGEAEDIAASLPDELAEVLMSHSDESPAGFSVEEFIDRVRERTDDSDHDDTEQGIESVMATLAAAGSRIELSEARGQLPNEYATLFETQELDE